MDQLPSWANILQGPFLPGPLDPQGRQIQFIDLNTPKIGSLNWLQTKLNLILRVLVIMKPRSLEQMIRTNTLLFSCPHQYLPNHSLLKIQKTSLTLEFWCQDQTSTPLLSTCPSSFSNTHLSSQPPYHCKNNTKERSCFQTHSFPVFLVGDSTYSCLAVCKRRRK